MRFHLELALKLGYPSRRAMYAAMTAADLVEWEAMQAIEPIVGEYRADLRAGIIAQAAIAPYAKKGHTPHVTDFMPFCKQPRRQMSLGAMKAQFAAAKLGFEQHRKRKG